MLTAPEGGRGTRREPRVRGSPCAPLGAAVTQPLPFPPRLLGSPQGLRGGGGGVPPAPGLSRPPPPRLEAGAEQGLQAQKSNFTIAY